MGVMCGMPPRAPQGDKLAEVQEYMKLARFSSLNVPIPNEENYVWEICGKWGKKGIGVRGARVWVFIWATDKKWKFWKWNIAF
jgi:hypothetical protein